MGILAQRIDEIRNDPGWLTRGDDIDGSITTSGVRVSAKQAFTLSTYWRCIDLLVSAVSMAPVDVVVKIGARRFPQFDLPSWLAMPHGPADPNYGTSDYLADVAMSVLTDGNWFTAVLPSVFDPQMAVVVPANRVDVKPGPLFDIKDEQGKVISTLGPYEMIHGWWLKLPGDLRGLSPLECLRRGIGGAIAAEDFASRFFGQGATLSFGVEVPGTLTKEQREQLSESLRRRHAGLQNSHAIGLLTNGGKFVTGLTPTPEQAQMLATRQFSVEEGCRPFGVPPHMVGSQQPGAVSYASVNGTMYEFKQFAVLPLVGRIENKHQRLVHVPDTIAAPNATAQMKLNLDYLERADLATRVQAYNTAILSGQMTPDEAREKEDREPAGGNAAKLLMQRQMVPIDDLGTAAPVPGQTVDAALIADKTAPLPAGEKQPMQAFAASKGGDPTPMPMMNGGPK